MVLNSLKLLFLLVLILSTQLVHGQLYQLTGQVIDEKEVPLAFATISIDGTDLGTVSKDDGSFIINNIPNNTFKVAIYYHRSFSIILVCFYHIRFQRYRNLLLCKRHFRH